METYVYKWIEKVPYRLCTKLISLARFEERKKPKIRKVTKRKLTFP